MNRTPWERGPPGPPATPHISLHASWLLLWLLATTPLAAATTAARADGVWLRDGELTFPIGIYHVSWYSPPAQLRADLEHIAAAGFDTVHASYTAGNDYEGFLDRAAQLGIGVITEGVDETWIAAHRRHPAVAGWSIGDDVHETVTPDQLTARHAAVRAADPDHVTMFTVWSPKRWGPFLPLGDYIAPYHYPISDLWLGHCDAVIAPTRRATPRRLGIPQAFAWDEQRAPTPGEYRNLVYQNLCNQVRGLITYPFRDKDTYLPDHAELWAEVRRVVPEVRALSPTLCDGTFTRLDLPHHAPGGIVAAYWQLRDTVTVVVLNTHQTVAQSVDIVLPIPPGAELRPLFSDRPQGLNLSGDHLCGEIAPVDVHVYRLAPPAPKPRGGCGTGVPAVGAALLALMLVKRR
jgi:hypothetical protein